MREVFQPPPFEWLLLTDRSVVSVVGVSSFQIWLPCLVPSTIHLSPNAEYHEKF